MKRRFTISIEDEFYNLVELEIKKLKLNSIYEFYNFLTKQYFTGGSANPELTIKQQTEKIKLELMQIKKPKEVLMCWKVAKEHGYTLDQYNELLKNQNQKPLPEPEATFQRTPESVSKQFKAYGTTIVHPRKEDADKCRCPDCNWCLDYKPKEITVELDHLINHLRNTHHRSPTEEEQKIILELIKNDR